MKRKVEDIDFMKVRRAAMDAVKTQSKCTGQYDPDANIAAAVEAAFREYENRKDASSLHAEKRDRCLLEKVNS